MKSRLGPERISAKEREPREGYGCSLHTFGDIMNFKRKQPATFDAERDSEPVADSGDLPQAPAQPSFEFIATKVASSNRWVFLSSCSSASARRHVSVRAFSTSDGLRLKISEECSNGKLFYVLIPADPLTGGWFGTLRIVQSWIANSLVPSPPPPPVNILPAPSPTKLRSYAQVVSGPCYSLKGRFVHHESVNWEKFRRWALRNWGTGLDAPIHKLGDGLWLLFCGTKDKVNRILALKRWMFDGHPLLLDKWISSAGRSNVLLNEDVIWVTASGIPLHLRSSDLFRQLGEACRRFLDFENGDSLSTVRIKIELTGALPEEVPICYDNVIFPVRIVREGMPISGFLPTRSVIEQGWRNKGKSSLSPCSVTSADLGLEFYRLQKDSAPNLG
ncbi:hypothetical protein LINPERHAP2_LOCUS12812 [Linum perenne]